MRGKISRGSRKLNPSGITETRRDFRPDAPNASPERRRKIHDTKKNGPDTNRASRTIHPFGHCLLHADMQLFILSHVMTTKGRFAPLHNRPSTLKNYIPLPQAETPGAMSCPPKEI